MCNTSIKQTAESFFGNAISTYTRAQAIEDGVLIDPGTMAKEAGFNKWPVALTANAWADCVAWTDDDSEQQVHQDQSGSCGISCIWHPMPFGLARIPVTGCSSGSTGCRVTGSRWKQNWLR